MRRVHLPVGANFEQWRAIARALLSEGVAPERVAWDTQRQAGLFGDAGEDADAKAAASTLRIPRELPGLLDGVIAHRDPQSRALAYRLLWRIAHGEPQLLQLVTDADVVAARAMTQAVRRDLHKMKAFVRFQSVATDDGGEVFVAWFEPEHFIVERVAPFFMRRFAGMRWSILTPYRCAHWDMQQLSLSEGIDRPRTTAGDPLETMWRTYYASIFNPARLKLRTMTREMPQRYWKNLPEAQLIPTLVREAPQRSVEMMRNAPTLPRKAFPAPVAAQAPAPRHDLDTLRRQAHDCRRCELWKPATQTVFGEGPHDARLMLVGEQPGDREDLAGQPFVGPAGRLLDRALRQAGLQRERLYLTNVVKHFRFEPRGKLRLHRRADAGQQAACRPWLAAEIAAVRPKIIVCLGTMAAHTLLGADFRLLQDRGQWHARDDGTQLIATVHPSYLLRMDEQAREPAYAQWVADLALAAERLMALEA